MNLIDVVPNPAVKSYLDSILQSARWNEGTADTMRWNVDMADSLRGHKVTWSDGKPFWKFETQRSCVAAEVTSKIHIDSLDGLL